MLLVPAARGRGIGTEAVGVLTRWAFNAVGLHRLTAQVEVGNWASRALAEKAGFTTHWGRKVLEIRPPVRIDKGAGIVSLLRDTDLAAALYVGDDVTDLDAFRGLDELIEKGRLGTAIKVGVRSDEGPAKLRDEADWMVEGTDGVRELLRALLG